MTGWMGLRGFSAGEDNTRKRENRTTRVLPSHDELKRRATKAVGELLRDRGSLREEAAPAVRDGSPEEREDILAGAVGNIMSSRVAVLDFDDTLMTAQAVFAATTFHYLPVVDDDGRIIGVVSDRDILHAASPFMGTVNEQNRDREIMARKVGTLMNREPVCVGMETSVMEAFWTMIAHEATCVLVADPDSKMLQGIVTWRDIVASAAVRLPGDREEKRVDHA